MLCPLRVSANNNSWPAPGRRGYSLESDGEPRSLYEINTMGPGEGGFPRSDVTYVSAASPWPAWTRGVVEERR